MNKQQQIQAYQQIQQYLQNNNIHNIFSNIVQQIILQRPTNVIDHIIKQLQTPQKNNLFIIGPPGLSISSSILKVLQSIDNKYEILNIGDFISKRLDKLKTQDKDNFNSLLLINQQSLKDAVVKMQQCVKSQKNYIIQGFPKNLRQAHLLQQKNIYTKNILFVNVDIGNLYTLVSKKLTSNNPSKTKDQIQVLTRNAMSQYTIYTNQLKNFYKQYREIDLSKSIEQEFISQQLIKAFTIKTIRPIPRIGSQIIIIGAPYSGRTVLGRKIAEYYNLVYISTSFLIAEQIRKDTIHGRKLKDQYINNQMIDNFMIEKLIQERICLKDCKMQGFVIEGYPKNKEQYDNIKSMKLNPTMIVAIDTPINHSRTHSLNNIQQSKLQARYVKWNDLSTHLRSTKDNIFWINPYLSIQNMQEQVIHQLQKSFN